MTILNEDSKWRRHSLLAAVESFPLFVFVFVFVLVLLFVYMFVFVFVSVFVSTFSAGCGGTDCSV